MDLIKVLEQEEMARLTEGKTIPDFRAGDTAVSYTHLTLPTIA